MSVRVDFEPTSVIEADLGLEPKGSTQVYFQYQCYRYMDKYVPRRDGNLRKNVNINYNEGLIEYESPYAHYMYLGMVMSPSYPIKKNGKIVGYYSKKGDRKHYNGKLLKYSTPGTGAFWDERMKYNDMEEIIKKVQKHIETGE